MVAVLFQGAKAKNFRHAHCLLSPSLASLLPTIAIADCLSNAGSTVADLTTIAPTGDYCLMLRSTDRCRYFRLRHLGREVGHVPDLALVGLPAELLGPEWYANNAGTRAAGAPR